MANIYNNTVNACKALLLALLLSAAPASGQENASLTDLYIGSGEWPPYLSAHLPGGGPQAQMVTAAFASVGITAHYRYYPWLKSMELAKSGELDATIGWVFSKEREKYFWYGSSIGTSTLGLLHIANDPVQWRTLEDLKGLHIGSVRGFYYTEEFEMAEKSGLFKVTPFDSSQQCLLKLLQNKIDIMISDVDVVQRIMSRLLTSEEIQKVKLHRSLLRTQSSYFLISRKVPNANHYQKLLTVGLENIKRNGRYDEIMNARQSKVE